MCIINIGLIGVQFSFNMVKVGCHGNKTKCRCTQMGSKGCTILGRKLPTVCLQITPVSHFWNRVKHTHLATSGPHFHFFTHIKYSQYVTQPTPSINFRTDLTTVILQINLVPLLWVLGCSQSVYRLTLCLLHHFTSFTLLL